jgi:tetratricopeptide (TPR) repeat protein
MVPDDKESIEVLSQLYGAVGDEDARIEALENALKQDPSNTENMFNLGQIYFKQNEFGKAEEKFKMYLAIKPDDVYALEFLGNSQQNLGKFREAIATYEKIIAIDPEKKKIFCEMATCYKELGRYSTARIYANKTLRIDSNFGLAYIVLGEIYETCADECAKGRQLKFDDKLIYEKAYLEYQKAKRDPAYADLAVRRMEYVQQSKPTTADRFMHPDQKQSKLDCHKWIY